VADGDAKRVCATPAPHREDTVDQKSWPSAAPIDSPHPERSLAEQIASRRKALSVRELAELLGVAQTTIYDHARDGRLPAIRIGSAIRIDPKVAARVGAYAWRLMAQFIAMEGRMKTRLLLLGLVGLICCSVVLAQMKHERISLTPRSNVSTSEVGKELDRHCPGVVLTDDSQKADFRLEAWDTGAGAGRKPYKFTLFKDGERVFSTETRGLAGAMKDVCAFINK
jgi:excisionase family DNA binding protein